MSNWKRAVVLGSLGAGAVLAITGRRTTGAVLAGVGVAVLASEHPEKVQELWERAPEYMEKGTQIVNLVSGFLERLSEYQQRRIESTPYVV
jgi:ABC-type protease/lipase transport system fused ATPase/permease subunit